MLPKKFYRVVLITHGELRFYQKGGGTYHQKRPAEDQVARLRYQGIECELYESDPVVWNLINNKEENDEHST